MPRLRPRSVRGRWTEFMVDHRREGVVAGVQEAVQCQVQAVGAIEREQNSIGGLPRPSKSAIFLRQRCTRPVASIEAR